MCSIQITSGQTECKTISEQKVLMEIKVKSVEELVQNFKKLDPHPSCLFSNLI